MISTISDNENIEVLVILTRPNLETCFQNVTHSNTTLIKTYVDRLNKNSMPFKIIPFHCNALKSTFITKHFWESISIIVLGIHGKFSLISSSD